MVFDFIGDFFLKFLFLKVLHQLFECLLYGLNIDLIISGFKNRVIIFKFSFILMTANDKLKRLHHEFDGLLDINTNGEY